MVSAIADGAPLPVGYRLEHYTILGLLAEGGMAQVYLARDEEELAKGDNANDSLVILKRVLPHLSHNSRFESMFVNEARLATMIRHPNVVEVKGLLREQGELFLVMEFLDGKNLLALGKTCDSGGFWVPFPLLARIVADAAAGVHQAHILTDEFGRTINFIHRDLSPENIVVCFDGRVKVVDFGIAKARMSPDTTQVGVIKGKLNYLAPEAVLGLKIDARADIYALGVTLYLFLTARFPYTGRNTEALLQAMKKGDLTAPRQINPHIPETLENICMRCLEHDREKRFASAAELQAALVSFISQKGGRIYAEHIARFMEDMYPRETDAMRAWVAGISGTNAKHKKLPPPDSVPAEVSQAIMKHGGTQEIASELEARELDTSDRESMRSGYTDPGQWSQASDVHNRATLIVSSLEASGLHVIPHKQAPLMQAQLNSLEGGETQAMGQKAHELSPGLATATSIGQAPHNKPAFAQVRSTRRSHTRTWVMWALVAIILLLGGSLALLAKTIWENSPNPEQAEQSLHPSELGIDKAGSVPPLEPLVNKKSLSTPINHVKKPIKRRRKKRKSFHRKKRKKHNSRRHSKKTRRSKTRNRKKRR